MLDPLIPTIFHEHWWLDAATKGRAEISEVTEGGRTVGRLPYVKETRLGLHSINMPTLTHFLGPGINDGSGSEPNRFVRRQAITRELIRRLPQFSSFRQKLHHNVKDVLAFQAEDFEVTAQFTLSNSVPRVKEPWALVNVAVLRNTLGGVRYSIRSGLSGFVFFRAIRCREQRCLRGRHKVAA